jgi:hypothetical protein
MPNPNSKGTSELKPTPGENTITKTRKLEGTKKSQRSFSFVFSSPAKLPAGKFRAFVIGCAFGLPFPTLGALFQQEGTR